MDIRLGRVYSKVTEVMEIEFVHEYNAKGAQDGFSRKRRFTESSSTVNDVRLLPGRQLDSTRPPIRPNAVQGLGISRGLKRQRDSASLGSLVSSLYSRLSD